MPLIQELQWQHPTPDKMYYSRGKFTSIRRAGNAGRDDIIFFLKSLVSIQPGGICSFTLELLQYIGVVHELVLKVNEAHAGSVGFEQSGRPGCVGCGH